MSDVVQQRITMNGGNVGGDLRSQSPAGGKIITNNLASNNNNN